MEINIVDGIIALTVLFFAMRSFMQGIIQEVLHLASWVVTIYLTLYTYEGFIPFFAPYIDSENIVVGVAIATAFVVYLVTFYTISFLINRMFSVSVITPVNKALGLVFGIGKGILIISVLYMGLASIVKDRMPKIITDSQSEPMIQWVSKQIAHTFPKDLQNDIVEKLKQAGKTAANDPIIKDELKKVEKAVKNAVDTKSGADDSAD